MGTAAAPTVASVTVPITLSRRDARRIAVRASLLDVPRPTDMTAVVDRLAALAIDPIAAIAPAADLMLWSRLGAGYDPLELAAAIDDHRIIEVEGFLRPASQLALLRAEMAAWPNVDGADGQRTWRHTVHEWVVDNESFRRELLRRLAADGPLPAVELDDTSVRPWRSTGWTNRKNVTQMLGQMARMGQVAVAGRSGHHKTWDLAERVYPDEPVVELVEARRRRDEVRLRALGIARPSGVGTMVEPVAVGATGVVAIIDGVQGEWRVDPEQLDRLGRVRFRGRTAFVGPFDRLASDRVRLSDVFQFEYVVEMYKPAIQRRWGYYALPILDGDTLIGKLDATADRTSGVLRVHAVHEDEPFSAAETRRVHAEIDELARWLELDVERPG